MGLDESELDATEILVSWMRHHAICATTWSEERAEEARAKVADIPGIQVTDVYESDCNGYCSFFVIPDGSKEGWNESDLGDERRAKAAEILDANACDWVEVYYGCDTGMPGISNICGSDRRAMRDIASGYRSPMDTPGVTVQPHGKGE